MSRCLGFSFKYWRRCRRDKGGRLCADHKYQPLIVLCALVFTVGPGVIAYLSLFPTDNDQKQLVKSQLDAIYSSTEALLDRMDVLLDSKENNDADLSALRELASWLSRLGRRVKRLEAELREVDLASNRFQEILTRLKRLREEHSQIIAKSNRLLDRIGKQSVSVQPAHDTARLRVEMVDTGGEKTRAPTRESVPMRELPTMGVDCGDTIRQQPQILGEVPSPETAQSIAATPSTSSAPHGCTEDEWAVGGIICIRTCDPLEVECLGGSTNSAPQGCTEGEWTQGGLTCIMMCNPGPEVECMGGSIN